MPRFTNEWYGVSFNLLQCNYNPYLDFSLLAIRLSNKAKTNDSFF